MMEIDKKLLIEDVYAQYDRSIKYPMYAIFAFGLVIGFVLAMVTLNKSYLLLIVAGFPLGLLWALFGFMRWFVWAMNNVATPTLLYHSLLRSGAMFPKGSWLNYIYPKIGVNSAEVEAAWLKIDSEDEVLSLKSLIPQQGRIEVAYSNAPLWENLFGTLLFLVLPILIFFLDINEKQQWMFIAVSLVVVFFLSFDLSKAIKRYKKNALVFSPEEFIIAGESFRWHQIGRFLIRKSGNDNYQIFLETTVLNPTKFEEEIQVIHRKLNKMKMNADRIDELFTIYHKLYSSPPNDSL